ncbi:MAG: ribonuclease P protein component [Verrucomicrobiota bacterium]|nr:ribonuclease P protein component [Verrucomicrobiota bacterium]
MSLTFPKSARLKTRADFERVKENGKRISCRYFVLNILASEMITGHLALGIITTKKMGAANKRARARRLIRETFRINQHNIKTPCHLVVVAKRDILTLKQKTVENEFIRLCQKLEIWKD